MSDRVKYQSCFSLAKDISSCWFAGWYSIARGELLAWMNDLIHPTQITKIEQCGTGAVYCQVSYISFCWRTTADCDRSLTLSTVREDVRQDGNHADMQVMYQYSDWNSMPDKSMNISRTTKSFRDLSSSIKLIRWALITCCHEKYIYWLCSLFLLISSSSMSSELDEMVKCDSWLK